MGNFVKHLLLSILAIILPTATGAAQTAAAPGGDRHFSAQITADSVTYSLTKWQRFERSQFGRGVLAGAPLVVLAPIAKTADHDFRSLRHDFAPRYSNEFDNWLQYTPAVALVGMKLAGVEGESTWGEMLTADAAAVVIMAGAVNLTKRVVGEERPDETNRKSFPSGHTATAFMTATMLSHEYGSRYPWISVASYAVASSTGLMRMANNRHWLNDVMTGAGIGIISTELGYLVSNLIFHKPLFGEESDYDFSRDYRPSFVSFNMASNIPLCAYRPNGTTSFRTKQGAQIGVEGAWFMNRHVGFGGRLTFSDLNFEGSDATYPDCRSKGLRQLTTMAGAYFSLPICGRLQAGTKALVGVNHFYELNDAASGRKAGAATTVGASTGLWLNVRMQPALSYRIFCDYDIYAPKAQSGKAMQCVNIGGAVAVNL